jgi:hypothetical protein
MDGHRRISGGSMRVRIDWQAYACLTTT